MARVNPPPKVYAAAMFGPLAITLLVCLMTAAGFGCKQEASSTVQPKPEVEVMEVVQKDVPIYSEWIGTTNGMENAKIDPPQFQAKRAGPIERTIWRVDGFITVLKQEPDGDYHLVVQGSAGDTIVAEVPTPTTTFIGDSPWLANIKEARQAVDDKLVHNLNPRDFVLPPGGTKLVPRSALSGDLPIPAMANFPMPESFVTPPEREGEQMPVPTFQTAIKSVPVRITGVGFFDRDHGQTGRAPNIFELHPVLKVEFP